MDEPPSLRHTFRGKLSAEEQEAFHEDGSARSAAIVLSAVVENRLTSLLKRLMEPDKRLIAEMFNPVGPLGPFGTKVNLAYLVRVIDEPVYRDLIIVTKIRNRFAHDLSIKSFDDQKIRDLFTNMNTHSAFLQMMNGFKTYDPGDSVPQDKWAEVVARMGLVQSSTLESFRMCLSMLVNRLIEIEEEVTDRGGLLLPFLPPPPAP